VVLSSWYETLALDGQRNVDSNGMHAWSFKFVRETESGFTLLPAGFRGATPNQEDGECLGFGTACHGDLLRTRGIVRPTLQV
jgi:hypothetical protein